MEIARTPLKFDSLPNNFPANGTKQMLTNGLNIGRKEVTVCLVGKIFKVFAAIVGLSFIVGCTADIRQSLHNYKMSLRTTIERIRILSANQAGWSHI
jgi:hypothetical protein